MYLGNLVDFGFEYKLKFKDEFSGFRGFLKIKLKVNLVDC
jgi:hypothetical protein